MPLQSGALSCYIPDMTESAPLSPPEISRYMRHILLPEIGGPGQQKLKAARVLVIGAGGLGSPVIEYLAGAGVGEIGIVDDDVVSLSNLQRQLVHETDSVGLKKIESAARRVAALNPHVTVVPHDLRLDAENAGILLIGYHLLVDGSDNFATRYAAADAAEIAGIPLVTGAVGRFDGSLTVLKPYETGVDGKLLPRYRDLFPEIPPEGMLPVCAETGVIGALTGVIGTLMAMEAIKLITAAGEPLVGRLMMYDALAARFDVIRYRRRVDPRPLPNPSPQGGGT
jgi:molybdopterin/thiamine biosynthesis adenylyltransferase